MAQGFQIGDLVQLKSGSPIMTIETVRGSATGQHQCTWFVDNKVVVHKFHADALEKAEKPASQASGSR